MATKTERRSGRLDAEAVFRAFVHNANLLAGQRRTALGAPATPMVLEPSAPISLASLSLEDRRGTDVGPPPAGLADAFASLPEGIFEQPTVAAPRPVPVATDEEAEPIELVRRSLPPPGAEPSPSVQRAEAERLVPDVRAIAPPQEPVPERSESGEMPPRQLERVLSDMRVLLRYGHLEEVERRLEELLTDYPTDLLLLRRVAEFHLQTDNHEAAKACLFRLAKGLFERRNVHGMGAALRQVLALDPSDERAHRLLSLLERRQG